MIEIGRSMGATWILPWDGNNSMTQDSVKALIQKIAKETGKYFVSPTHRVIGSNAQILDTQYQRERSKEPMISFIQSWATVERTRSSCCSD
jgi:hypothetical protein